MKLLALVPAAIVGMAVATSAVQAQEYITEPSADGRYESTRRPHKTVRSSYRPTSARAHVQRRARTRSRGRVRVARFVKGVGRRPGKWCGWWMRTQLGGGPQFNVAWNWRKYGTPSGPQVGAVVIWRHHVGMITGRTEKGRWIVKSGNDGGRVRERPRSVRGAQFRI